MSNSPISVRLSEQTNVIFNKLADKLHITKIESVREVIRIELMTI